VQEAADQGFEWEPQSLTAEGRRPRTRCRCRPCCSTSCPVRPSC
jgi:hypothetical protein